MAVPRLPAISRDALRLWGVDASAESAILATCASFVRVSPVNLVLSGLLRRLLTGERPSGGSNAGSGWTPPPTLGLLPPLVDPAALSPSKRGLLATLGTTVGGQAFVPGLYRMLASWPAFLAHAATVLRPHLDAVATRAACQELLTSLDAEIPAVFASLPPLPTAPPMPPAHQFADVLAALDAYRTTSPEMVVFGRMLGDALPREEGTGIWTRSSG